MRTIKLNILKLHQSIGTIYISKIKPSDLIAMSVVDRRRIEEDDEILGIQRELKKDKVIQIQNYLTSLDATFPNSIIVNTKQKFIVNENENELELEVNDETFTIIDGQHRVEGFRGIELDNFELLIAIFKDLENDQQANIFSTINSQQTKVDPSLNLSLELNSKIYTPKKMMIEIAQSFNYDKESPWCNNIKMLGSKTDGIISLAAFVKPLLEMTYPEKDYYLIRNELKSNEKEFPSFSSFSYNVDKYLFWELYKRKDVNSTYKILFNYFNSLKTILDKDWLNNKSLLNKTTGYNAIIKLFCEVAKKGFKEGELSYDFFLKQLKPLSKMNGTITSENYGASGIKASNELYDKMKEILTSTI
ncbi:MAG: DGQHR domain-containing protein [Bacteroidales bacterium]|nr:DGQHR domain-containing protein [Bacteroidales bacterium]